MFKGLVNSWTKMSWNVLNPIPAEKNNRTLPQNTVDNVMDLMVLMGIVLVLMETIMVSTGVWWVLLVGC